MIVRARYRIVEERVYVSVFAAPSRQAVLEFAGELTFPLSDWTLIAPRLESGAGWELVPEDA